MGLDIFSQYTNYSPVSVPEVGNVLMPVLTDYRFALLGVNKTATDVDAYLAAHKDKQEFLTKYGLTPKLRGGRYGRPSLFLSTMPASVMTLA